MGTCIYNAYRVLCAPRQSHTLATGYGGDITESELASVQPWVSGICSVLFWLASSLRFKKNVILGKYDKIAF